METAPFSLFYLILTEDCNLRCSYCYENTNRCKNNYMSFDTAKKSFDFLCSNALKHGIKKMRCTFFGGEPLLNLDLIIKAFHYMIDKASTNNIDLKFSLITNGTIYNSQFENFILEWYKATKTLDIQISIDGTPEVQDKNRKTIDGKPTSGIIEKNISNLKKFFEHNQISFSFINTHSVITKNTIQNVFNNYKYFKSLGINNISFVLPRDEEWNDNDISDYIKQLSLIADYVYDECVSANSLEPYKSSKHIIGEIDRDICEAGKSLCAISPNGDIYPCHRAYFYTPDLKFGNVFDGIIYENNRKIFLNASKKNMHVEQFSCSDCENTECKICPASNLKQYEDVNKCNPVPCAIQKAKWNFIIETKKKFYKILNKHDYNRCNEMAYLEAIH